MELTPMHKRFIVLDVHQAKITACAVVEHDDGWVEVTKRDFRGNVRAFHGRSRSNAASTAMDQLISLSLASRVRFAGLPNAPPGLDSTSREKG